MSSKSAILIAILAFFLCLSSTVAADLLIPGNPVNCTIFKETCKKHAEEQFLNK
ncbi:hypothetical protein BG004_002645, partial [Podila humilis]